MRINKKASVFAVALVLLAFVAFSYTVGSFAFFKDKVKIQATPSSELIDLYNKKIKEEFYNKELLKLESNQKFYEIIKDGAVSLSDSCNILPEGYIEWNEDCKPNKEELEKDFVKEIKYTDKKTMNEKGYLNYQLDYSYEYKTSIDLEKLVINLKELETIYEQAVSCKSNSDISSCMKLKNWGVLTKKEKINNEDYILFDVSTKRSFFFDDKFEPLGLKFAIKFG